MNFSKSNILDQHDEILRKLNLVVSSLSTKSDSLQLLSDFESYVEYHFAYEETIMQDSSYPRIESHMLEHDYTISEIKSLIFWTKMHQNEEYPIEILRNIIITHVNQHDTELLEWLNQNEILYENIEEN